MWTWWVYISHSFSFLGLTYFVCLQGVSLFSDLHLTDRVLTFVIYLEQMWASDGAYIAKESSVFEIRKAVAGWYGERFSRRDGHVSGKERWRIHMQVSEEIPAAIQRGRRSLNGGRKKKKKKSAFWPQITLNYGSRERGLVWWLRHWE